MKSLYTIWTIVPGIIKALLKIKGFLIATSYTVKQNHCKYGEQVPLDRAEAVNCMISGVDLIEASVDSNFVNLISLK